MDAFPTLAAATAAEADAVFAADVDQVRARIAPEVVFTPGQASPCNVGGLICRTSADVVAAYKPGPSTGCTSQEWSAIGDFVRACVGACAPCAPATAQRQMMTATHFVAWCVRNDVPLDAEAMFTPARVEHYVTTQLGHTSSRSQATTRSYLRVVGMACTRRASWIANPAPYNGKRTTRPYTREQIAAYWDSCVAQSTPVRRRAMACMLTLGLGAGLRAVELFELRAEQIIEHPAHDGVLVVVLMDRLIPVRHEMSDMLIHLCDETLAGRLIGDSAKRVTARPQLHKIIDTLVIPESLPALTMTNLRSTWAVACLADGMNPAEFAAVAGTIGATTFSLYTRFVPMRDEWMRVAAGMATMTPQFGLGVHTGTGARA